MEEVSAILRNAHASAYKVRLVADQVRGLPIDRALNILEFSLKKSAVLVKKVLNSAIANAEHNKGMDIDELKVAKIMVDEGPTYKRMHARAKGRGNQIFKRSCHIKVVVANSGVSA